MALLSSANEEIVMRSGGVWLIVGSVLLLLAGLSLLYAGFAAGMAARGG